MGTGTGIGVGECARALSAEEKWSGRAPGGVPATRSARPHGPVGSPALRETPATHVCGVV
jgi:hypothetical protein